MGRRSVQDLSVGTMLDVWGGTLNAFGQDFFRRAHEAEFFRMAFRG